MFSNGWLFIQRKLWLRVNFATAAAAKSLQLCPTLCEPTDGSPPGSPVPEILQARTLEWVPISFSNAWKWKVKVKSLSRVLLLATPWTAAHQAPPSMGFSRQEYWSGVPLPSPNFFFFFCCWSTSIDFLDVFIILSDYFEFFRYIITDLTSYKEFKMVQLLWKTVWQFFKKLNIHLTIWSSHPTPRYSPLGTYMSIKRLVCKCL